MNKQTERVPPGTPILMGKDNKYDKLVNRVPDSDKGQKQK